VFLGLWGMSEVAHNRRYLMPSAERLTGDSLANPATRAK
jgi:hypothetical protein